MNSMQYAGILKRFFAALIDNIILSAIGFVLFEWGQPKENNLKYFVGSFVLNLIIYCAYDALFQSSPAQATPGKMALGIAVTDKSGERISLAQASIRVLVKLFWLILIIVAASIGSVAKEQGEQSPLWILSGLLLIVGLLIFLIGYLMAGFTPQKQALHDRIARTFAIESEDESRKFPQKVLLQLAALALVSRLIFQLTPATEISWLSWLKDEPTTQTGTTTQTDPSPNPSPSSQAEGDGKVLNICGESVLRDNSDLNLDGKWEFQYHSQSVKYKVELEIEKISGKMITQFFDPDKSSRSTIQQDIRLGTSKRGTWIMGFNPVDYITKEEAKNYAADNFFLEINLDGEFNGYNCDDRGRRTPISIQKLS